jgi:hypothetical protein
MWVNQDPTMQTDWPTNLRLVLLAVVGKSLIAYGHGLNSVLGYPEPPPVYLLLKQLGFA